MIATSKLTSGLLEAVTAVPETFTIGVQDGIAVVSLNRPAKLNAWTGEMQTGLTDAFATFENDPAIEAVVVTGTGDRAFCAGQDLGETAQFGREDIPAWLRRLRQLYEMPLRSDKPYVAGLNGVAAGSGYQFAMLCDMRVAHRDVTIGQPEVKSGIPSITGQYITMLSLGWARTTELMLTGRLLDATEAREIGLISSIVDKQAVLAESITLARFLASQPKNAVAATKRSIYQRVWPGLEESFRAAEAHDVNAWAGGEPQRVATDFLGRHRGTATADGTAS